jgi:hypothetical protein
MVPAPSSTWGPLPYQGSALRLSYTGMKWCRRSVRPDDLLVTKQVLYS